ncbi:putative pentatricopeptide repeat-containing protein At1g69350, mitochondrial [Selaginella moellendorffii]|uniref:putative pentatricopeptide repeat-containing protein At1g69350, mitochondrial n=1 Tax=Selaginella moellendorffii TaxID=88036 RepID=UPI000D1CFA76|nr:putative pentatricopeptide repeat-containing protein At1g69350, mitochondrial [Selaginella moellendorffii]|eukprot:XP_024537106.1 putative pentatricopeptide repeat-containing protein At1g69350, mitochondrial [Selaginella moellendorffii]
MLVLAYGKCRSVSDARKVFDGIEEPNVFSWTVIIAAYAENEDHREAVQFFRRMNQEGVRANQVTLITVLSSCSASLDRLADGRTVHGCITGSSFETYRPLQTALVNMYGKYGRVREARAVFDGMAERDVITWSAMITAYAQGGHGRQAWSMYHGMSLDGVKPNEVTFVAICEACCSFPSFLEREALVEHVDESGYDCYTIVGNSIANMFSKCGDPSSARQAFDRIPRKDVVSWSVVISSLTQHELADEGLLLFRAMLAEGVAPNHATLVNCLDACSFSKNLGDGRVVHGVAKSLGMESSSPVVATAVLDMYSRCGSLVDAKRMFEKISSRDVVAWTAMISAYQQEGLSDQAMKLFRSMDLDGVRPNEVTFATVLLSCSSLEQTRTLHECITGTDSERDAVLGTSLVSCYGKYGSLEAAKTAFDEMPARTVASWNALLTSYVNAGRGEEIFELFWRMELEGVRGDETTFMRLVAVCMDQNSLARGRMIHSRIIEEGLEASTSVSNALITFYGQSGSLAEASRVFGRMAAATLISWTAIISAFAQHSHSQRALELYQRMDSEGIKPDDVTFITILFACSHSGMVEEGRRYFLAMVGDHGIESSVQHLDCLVDLLGRAGWLEEAEKLARSMPLGKNRVALTAVFGACQIHDDSERAERLSREIEFRASDPAGWADLDRWWI